MKKYDIFFIIALMLVLALVVLVNPREDFTLVIMFVLALSSYYCGQYVAELKQR